MLNKFIIIATAAAACVAATAPSALATDGHCTMQPQASWRTMDDARAAAEAKGLTVSKMEQDGSCYEAYAHDKDQRRVKVYFDPVTLDVVRIKDKS